MCRFYCCCYGRVYGFIIFYYFDVSKFVRLYHDCCDIFVNLQWINYMHYEKILSFIFSSNHPLYFGM